MRARKPLLFQGIQAERRRSRHLPSLFALMAAFGALAALLAVAAAPNAGLAARQSGGITSLGDSQPPPTFAILPLEVEAGGTAQAVNDAGQVVGTAVNL